LWWRWRQQRARTCGNSRRVRKPGKRPSATLPNYTAYDLLEVMEGTEKHPENDSEKSTWVRKSAQGYLLLEQALGSSQIRHIKPFQRDPEKGPKAWAALKGVHARATTAVAVVLERQMAALRIEEDEAVEERGAEILRLVDAA
ncbi:unnamed protein product, partial [Closterium sp. NIES-54]